MSHKNPVHLAIAFVLFVWLSAASDAAELRVTLGEQNLVIANGQYGFQHFPDEAVAVLGRNPLRYLMVVGDHTIIMEGDSFGTATSQGVVLQPSKSSGAYDEQYAGINSIYIRKHGEVLGFFHAEKPTGGTNEHGTHRFYATVGLAVSKNNGYSFEKIGAILTGRPEDPASKQDAQGNANPSICLNHTGEWLYAYYTDHSRRDPATGNYRSVTCMARSKVSDGGRPGTWFKYYKGSFDESGLGGNDSQVADCWGANVTYVPQMKKYLMFGLRGGFSFFESEDGINWKGPTILFVMTDYPFVGREIACYPSLYIQGATSKGLTGTLLYAYSHNYGHQAPQSPHYFVARSIQIRTATAKTSTTHPGQFDKRFVGKYRVEVKDESGATDNNLTLDLRDDQTASVSNGQSGTWETKGNRLFVKLPSMAIRPATRHKDGTFSGTLSFEASGAILHYKLKKIE
jgi:hypothetical protein